MYDGAVAERTVVSLLTDDPLLEADQVEVVGARRDDGLRTLQVEEADAADVTVLVQLGLAGGGEGGGEFPDASSPGLVAVPGDEDVGGEVHQGLHSRHQADAEDGETPGAVDQCSGGEEEVNSSEVAEKSREQEVLVEVAVGGRQREEDGS